MAGMDLSALLVVLRGGGDLATGVAYRLAAAGITPLVLELPQPLVVRRRVALATALLEGEIEVDGLRARPVAGIVEAAALAQEGVIPVMASPALPPFPRPIDVLVDARMAKRNIDTRQDQARLVIALGPGFTAGEDCHAIVETMRGHTLGRVIWRGQALADTGTPGLVAGKGAERVVRAPVAGRVNWLVAIGDSVAAGQPLGDVAGQAVRAPFAGVVRGLIAPGTPVPAGLKIGDVDARGDAGACFTISDKALAVGAGVLEGILRGLLAAGRSAPGTAVGRSGLRPYPLASLPAAFDLDDGELVALVGAGGKTSLLFALAGALPGGVVCTTTTHLGRAELERAPAVVRREALAELGPALRRFGRALVVGPNAGGKVAGVPPELPDALWERGDVRYVLVEADGSRQRPIKAPAAHEPVIPAAATLVVPVVGLSALGRPMGEAAHRPERVTALTGLAPGDPVTPAALAALLAHEEGGLKGVPAGARVVAYLNQADTPARLEAARVIASAVLRQRRVRHVVVGRAGSARPVEAVWRRVRGVVLAAGESRRMGQTKQLLTWGETTVLGQTLRHLAASRLFDAVVVTGHEGDAVAAEAARHGVPALPNPDYAAGEMLSSLQVAVRALPADIGAVVVLLADQPWVEAAVLDGLLAAHAQGLGRLIAPAHGGRRGNPVLIDRAFFAALLALPAGAAPRDLLATHPDELYLVPVADDAVLRDLDTPADYAAQRPG